MLCLQELPKFCDAKLNLRVESIGFWPFRYLLDQSGCNSLAQLSQLWPPPAVKQYCDLPLAPSSAKLRRCQLRINGFAKVREHQNYVNTTARNRADHQAGIRRTPVYHPQIRNATGAPRARNVGCRRIGDSAHRSGSGFQLWRTRRRRTRILPMASRRQWRNGPGPWITKVPRRPANQATKGKQMIPENTSFMLPINAAPRQDRPDGSTAWFDSKPIAARAPARAMPAE